MKQLNTLTRYLVIAIATFAISSCSKNENNVPDNADPKMLSFGFYTEDNEGTLFRDYIIAEVTGNAILVEVPREIDRTQLVARFTTTDNTTITANGALQQSGVTAMDFSTPVDYIVTEGQTNVRYTVTVANAADFVWSRIGAYSDHPASSFEMRINTATGAPHFLYMLNSDETDSRKAFVAKYNDNNWTTLGENISGGRISSNMGMAFNSDGNVYVSYTDYDTDPSQSPVIQRYNGSSWSILGNTPTFPARVTYSTLGINPANDQPIFFGYIDDRNYTVPRRATTVSFFDGSSWNIDNQITGRPSTQVGGIMRTKTVDGTLYLGVYNNNVGQPHTYSIYTYSQNSWSTILDNGTEPDATNLNFRDFDMDVAPNGDIYIIASDNAEETFKPRVKKYTAATQTWSQVGNTIDVNQATTRHFAMAVSPAGTPHVIYRNEQNFPVVVAFDAETQDWGTPRTLESVTTENVFIEFAPDGTGYAAYINEAKNIVLHKYDVPTN